MKIAAMTYNICSGRNLAGEQDVRHAASVIGQMQPDFVVLNEVRNGTEDVGNINQAHELGKITGYTSVFGRSIDVLGGEYGNGLLTRLPLVEWNVIHIPDAEPSEKGYYEHRSILRCVLQAEEQEITVLGTHFGLMPGEQKLAVQTVMDTLKAETRPVLLMGDLNATPDAPVLSPLMAALTDSACESAILTFPSDAPKIKIDYILHTAHFACQGLESPNTQCSDHRPLMAVLTLGQSFQTK